MDSSPKAEFARRRRKETVAELPNLSVVPYLALDEPLSPELVLVLPPELRARVLAGLGPPVWPTPRPLVRAASTPIDEPVVRSLGAVVVARAVQLGLIFVAVTILTVALSLVAEAVR
jgi:hypothetical protein